VRSSVRPRYVVTCPSGDTGYHCIRCCPIGLLEGVLEVLFDAPVSQTAAHEVNHGDQNHGFTVFRQEVVVFAQAAVPIEPRESPFHDPAFRQHDKAGQVIRSFDDLQGPMVRCLDPLDQLAGIAPVGPDQPQAAEALAQAVQHQPGAIAILNIACVYHGHENQTQGIDEQMALAAQDLFAGVVAPQPPFSVVFTL